MASGSVIELSNYLEQKISQKSADYAAVIFLKLHVYLSHVLTTSMFLKLVFRFLR